MIEHLVEWHDAECGGYGADLVVWRALADAAGEGTVLDVGAGTGRVSLDLRAHGHAVHAVDLEPALLARLRAQPGGEGIQTTAADAESFDLGEARFRLILVPMQTVQLLGDRPAFLRAAHRHLAPGGRIAVAVAAPLWPWDATTGPLPEPDRLERDGWHFHSQPVAVRTEADGRMTIERVRTATAPDGTETETFDEISLEAVDEARLHAEGETVGLRGVPGIPIAPTDEHVGAHVVILGA